MTAKALWGVIGGTGLTQLDELVAVDCVACETPYGTPSGAVVRGTLNGVQLAFLPRHGPQHTVAPHQINYRANVWAMAQYAERVVAVAAVGGIRADLEPRDLVLVDQVIDYTWGRAHTFFDAPGQVTHIDFTAPYHPAVRAALLRAAARAGVALHDGGVYGATQGPRLESAAEIDRLERDGCDVVGMTGMPEAALAAELELPYAACAVVVNPAAGRGGGVISMDLIRSHLDAGMAQVLRLLAALD